MYTCVLVFTCSKVKAEMKAVIQKQSCVRKNLWAVAVDERLACIREKENLHNMSLSDPCLFKLTKAYYTCNLQDGGHLVT